MLGLISCKLTTLLKMLTLNAAETFDMDERIGSIDPGKDADPAILERQP
jgi:imidazolonepropionase-like amidohydrolase